MRQRYGITELVWQSLPAERQRSWRLALLAAALLAAPFAGASGHWALDAAIAAAAVATAQFTVETHRRLSRLGYGLSRKRVIRVQFGACRIALLAFGCGFFLGIAGISAAALLRPGLLSAPSMIRFPALTVNLGLIFMATVIGRALFNVFRGLELEKNLWVKPVKPLREVLVGRCHVATSFPELVLLELLVHVTIFGYCMVASRFAGSLAGWTPPG
jgi:hypothetical protein